MSAFRGKADVTNATGSSIRSDIQCLIDDLSSERKARLDKLGFSWDAHSDKWEEGFSHLEFFFKEHGHCRVPNEHRTLDGFRLGLWNAVQRRNQSTMSPEKRGRLDKLDFVWDALDEQWEDGFRHLESFAKEHGHCRVPKTYKSPDGFPLGIWTSNNRKKRQPHERKVRLDGLGFTWDVLDEKWEEGIRHLESFVKEHGHCRVPQRYKSPDGFRLGQWIGMLRSNQATMLSERKERLDQLGFVWDALGEKWEVGFRHLESFVKEHGHCRVPQVFRTSDGYRLGRWFTFQRKSKNKMDPVRRERLEALPGWVWKVRNHKSSSFELGGCAHAELMNMPK
jgi:hypothetical protein